MHIGIGISGIKILHAIQMMQPCTIKLINQYMNGNLNSSSRSLRGLERLSLVHREKSKKSKALTKEELFEMQMIGLEATPTGRRPYIYTLTPAGERVADAINILIQEIREAQDESAKRTS